METCGKLNLGETWELPGRYLGGTWEPLPVHPSRCPPASPDPSPGLGPTFYPRLTRPFASGFERPFLPRFCSDFYPVIPVIIAYI